MSPLSGLGYRYGYCINITTSQHRTTADSYRYDRVQLLLPAGGLSHYFRTIIIARVTIPERIVLLYRRVSPAVGALAVIQHQGRGKDLSGVAYSYAWYGMVCHGRTGNRCQIFHVGPTPSLATDDAHRLPTTSNVKSSQVVGLRDRVAIIRTLIFSSPHPYAGSGEVWLR